MAGVRIYSHPFMILLMKIVRAVSFGRVQMEELQLLSSMCKRTLYVNKKSWDLFFQRNQGVVLESHAMRDQFVARAVREIRSWKESHQNASVSSDSLKKMTTSFGAENAWKYARVGILRDELSEKAQDMTWYYRLFLGDKKIEKKVEIDEQDMQERLAAVFRFLCEHSDKKTLDSFYKEAISSCVRIQSLEKAPSIQLQSLLESITTAYHVFSLELERKEIRKYVEESLQSLPQQKSEVIHQYLSFVYQLGNSTSKKLATLGEQDRETVKELIKKCTRFQKENHYQWLSLQEVAQRLCLLRHFIREGAFESFLDEQVAVLTT